jgi:hypothetical protein
VIDQEMSNLSDANHDINKMPELQELLRKMETEVCNHYVILNKFETRSNTTDTAPLKLELAVVIKSSRFENLVLKNVLLDTGCSTTNRKPNRKVWNSNLGSFVTKLDVELTFSFVDFAPSKEIKWLVAVDETVNSSRYLRKKLNDFVTWELCNLKLHRSINLHLLLNLRKTVLSG